MGQGEEGHKAIYLQKKRAPCVRSDCPIYRRVYGVLPRGRGGRYLVYKCQCMLCRCLCENSPKTKQNKTKMICRNARFVCVSFLCTAPFCKSVDSPPTPMPP